MPSAAKSRGVPQRRTSGLSSSSLPTGVESAGMFGVAMSRSRRAASASSRSRPTTSSWSLMARTRSLAASASSFFPCAIIWPMAFDAALRSACRASSWVMAARRASSSWEKRAASHEAWRFFIASATASWFSRTYLMSSMDALLRFVSSVLRRARRVTVYRTCRRRGPFVPTIATVRLASPRARHALPAAGRLAASQIPPFRAQPAREARRAAGVRLPSL